MTFNSLDYSPTPSPTHAVILLHGWGANAQDLASLAPYLDFPQIKFIFPNAPHPHPFSSEGRMWYDLDTGEHLETTSAQLKDWVRSLPEEINLPLEKIILGGFSQGGAMTLEVGHDLPLAGLLCLSGYLHPNLSFDVKDQKPIMVIHGTQDPVVPLTEAQKVKAQLDQATWPLDYHELSMAHEISPRALSLIQDFIQARCD